MNATPILSLGFLIVLLVVFLAVPFWIILRLKLPRWQKGLLGFNYYALLLIFSMQAGAMGSLAVANAVAKRNLETLIRVLRTEPVAKVTAALDEYLVHDEGSYYLLSDRFPEPKENEKEQLPPQPTEE